MDEQYQAYPWNVHTGHPVGQRYGLIADGLLQTGVEAAAAPTIAGYTPHAGDIKYKDLNDDHVIDQFDVAPIGKERPLIYYGVTAGVDYKGIEASILLQGVTNREQYVGSNYLDAGFQGQNNGYSQAYIQALGRWIPETGTAAMYPRLTAGGSGYNYSPLFQSSSYFLRNGNYIRIKNVAIGYNLPYAWIRKLKLRGIKIFANAQNLLRIPLIRHRSGSTISCLSHAKSNQYRHHCKTVNNMKQLLYITIVLFWLALRSVLAVKHTSLFPWDSK